MRQANVLYNRGRYDEALRTYREVLQRYPDCPSFVRLGLALCYYQLNQLELAKKVR